MKKFYFLAAIAALVLGLGSCTSEEVIDPVALNSEANAIGFGTFLDKTSKDSPFALPRQKAEDIELGNLETSGFKVWAYSTGASSWSEVTHGSKIQFMYNQQVDYTGSTWTYSPTKYWPMEINGLDCEWTKVSFFAASTATGITDFKTPSSNNENPEIHFTTAQHAAAQEDLVADVVVDKTGADVGTVQFTFDHILSKIEFRATLNGMSTTDDATTVTVNSVMVTYGAGMWKNGVYTFNTGSNTAIGNWTKGNSLWGASSVCVVMGSSTVLTATSSSVTLGVPMMIIPQKESIITDSPMTVTLSYTIAFNDSKISTQPLEKTYTPSFVLKSSADGGKYFPAYLPGKHYIFNFNISLKAVECEAVGVEKWKEEEEVIDCGC